MSYLEGREAFDAVLDRLVEAERRNAIETAWWQDGSAAKRMTETDLANAHRELQRLNAEIAANKPKLKELWEAMKHVLVILALLTSTASAHDWYPVDKKPEQIGLKHSSRVTEESRS